MLVAFGWPGASEESRQASKPQRKIEHIEANARSPHPDPAPTILAEQEVNTYLASDQIQFPAGVQSVKPDPRPMPLVFSRFFCKAALVRVTNIFGRRFCIA